MNSQSLYAHCLVQLTGLNKLVESSGEQTVQLYLEEFESRLNQLIRPGDKLMKLSNDKFCVLLQGIDERYHLELAAVKLVRLFDTTFDCIGELLPFKVHAGLVVPNETAKTTKELIPIAESALRFAMSANESFVIMEPGEEAEDVPDLSLLPRIERALERGEFQLFFQPKVSAAYRTIKGAEGLVRWLDPEAQKVIPPAAFIEEAEQNAVIVPLTEHLIRSAVSTCVQWDDSLDIAINVTPKLLEKESFIDVVADALDFYGLAPARLTLEITERGELPTSAFQYLQVIRDLGVRIAIDDFGTGHCSLMYFRDLPADIVKIDQAFVKNMRAEEKDRALVHGIISLSRYCGMTTVAEGVEDEATADMLTEMNCDELQGYYFGKPLQEQQFRETHLANLPEVKSGGYFSQLLSEGQNR